MINAHTQPRRRRATLALIATALVATTAIVAACGGGGSSSKDKTATSAAGSPTKAAAKTAVGTPGTPGAATKTVTGGTPGATAAATNASGSPVVDANGTPVAAAPDGTPVPGATAAAGETPAINPVTSQIPGTGENGADPVNEGEATYAAGADPSISGGDPTKPQQTVGDVPDTPPGASIDAKTIASPDVSGTDVQVIIDLDASKPGIQSTRDVKVGDVIRVGVVVSNAPSITALGLTINYDRTKIVAPTIINGASTDRNPDLNIGALGGAAAGWLCSPSPTGDLDDAGSGNGDGDPSTGQAYLGCFTPQTGDQGGTIVVATIEFRVTAKGSSLLSLAGVSVFDQSINQFARCDGDEGTGDPVPCRSATLNVQ